VAVSISLAHDLASAPAAYRLYLPETWTHDRRRRRTAGMPPGPVVADAGHGVVTAVREPLTARGIPYVGGISGETTGWPPGRAPRPPRAPGRAAIRAAPRRMAAD
jgi:SRSO17 transposase